MGRARSAGRFCAAETVRRHLTPEALTHRAPGTGIHPGETFVERFIDPAIEARIAASGLPVVPFRAKRGDVLSWHGRLVHRGSAPKVPGMQRHARIAHDSGGNQWPDMSIWAQLPTGGPPYAVFDTPTVD